MSEIDVSKYGINTVCDVTKDFQRIKKENEELRAKLEKIKEYCLKKNKTGNPIAVRILEIIGSEG